MCTARLAPAHAEPPDVSGAAKAFLATIGLWLGEVAVPDIRYEFTADGDSAGWCTLSFPLVVHLGKRQFGPRTAGSWLTMDDPRIAQQPRFAASLVPFIEPQYHRDDGAWRGLLGLRVPIFDRGTRLGLSFEGGGLIGEDGDGGMFGVGVGVGTADLLSLSMIGRSAWTTHGQRYDIAVDVQFPLNWWMSLK